MFNIRKVAMQSFLKSVKLYHGKILWEQKSWKRMLVNKEKIAYFRSYERIKRKMKYMRDSGGKKYGMDL